MRTVFKESAVRQIVREEYQLALISEGAWDQIAAGLKGVASWLGKQFSGVTQEWTNSINQIMTSMPNVKRELQVVIDALKAGMAESKESLKLDEGLMSAKKFGAEANAMNADIESDIAGPVYQFVKNAKTAPATTAESVFLGPAYTILSENAPSVQKKKLEESLGITTVLGTFLAAMGAVPMVLGGLAKLAKLLKAEKTAKHLEHAEHVAHAFENKVIDTVIPDLLAYAIYKYLTSKGIPISAEKIADANAFKASKAKATTKGIVYKCLLIYFAYNGLVGAFKAGVSLLGFVEGAATTVKGIELAKGAKEVAKLVKGAVT